MSTVAERLESIDFHDAAIEKIVVVEGDTDGDSVFVTFENWQERVMALHFKGVWRFSGTRSCGAVEEIHISTASPQIDKATRAFKLDDPSRDKRTFTQVRFLGDVDLCLVFTDFEVS